MELIKKSKVVKTVKKSELETKERTRREKKEGKEDRFMMVVGKIRQKTI